MKNKYFVGENFYWLKRSYADEYDDYPTTEMCGPYEVIKNFLVLDELNKFNEIYQNERDANFFDYLLDHDFINEIPIMKLDYNNGCFRNHSCQDQVVFGYNNMWSVLVPEVDLDTIKKEGLKASLENPMQLFNLTGSVYQEQCNDIMKKSIYKLVKINISVSRHIYENRNTLLIDDVPVENIVFE